MTSLINAAAALIATRNAALAHCFRTQPFRRVDLAMAFARGFVANPSDDIHPDAALVLRVAYADRESRRLAMD